MCRARTAALLTVVVVASLAAEDTTFTSTWKHPEAPGTSFAGKKVATLVITADQSLQVSGEEGLARELAARGVVPVAAYRLVPREELVDAARAKPWFERAAVEGVVAMRLLRSNKERTYVPGVWTQPYYSSFWNFYGYGWGSVADQGYVREDDIVVIETLVFSVARDRLLWAGVSESRNPKGGAALLKDLVSATVKEMRKQGLVAK